MTRAEAIKLLNAELWYGGGLTQAEKWVSVFERLGVLKLEEPKSIEERVRSVFCAYLDGEDTKSVLAELSSVGLKIVEA